MSVVLLNKGKINNWRSNALIEHESNRIRLSSLNWIVQRGGILVITELDLSQIQQALECERVNLVRGLIKQRPFSYDPENLSEDDLASLYESQELRSSLDELSSRKLDRIQGALERINKGIYGICLKCKKAIPAERLIALPYAELCVACQESLEGKSRGAQRDTP